VLTGDVPLADRHRLTGGALTLLLGDLHLGPVDRFGRRPLTDRLDVPALIGDVADVHVDQLEADLVDLLRHVLVDQAHELLAVLVDLLDRQGRDDQSQLAENDVLRLLTDCLRIQKQQSLRGVVHENRIRRDTNCERRWHVHADVVERQRPLERDLDHERLER
jgi:hypothetical protein